MSSAPVMSARQIVDRFGGGDGSAVPAASPAERVAWADALIDAGELDAAADQLTAALRADGSMPDPLLLVARRLTGEHALSVVTTAIAGDRVHAMTSEHDARPVAGALAHLAAGSDEAEEALLRAVLVVRAYEDNPHTEHRLHRAHRIAGVLAVLADAHRGEPERLDLWSGMLDRADRPRLAAAAALLAPLGLAEIRRRCDVVSHDIARHELVPLVRALAEADRVKEALELAGLLQPYARQEALVAVAEVVQGDRDMRAVVAAFRACPKASRERHQQTIHRHRFARVLLTFGRIDDALAELAKMRDCSSSEFGRAELVAELLRWFARRPDEATEARLRALLEALLTPDVIPQDLGAQIVDVLRAMFVLADPALRAEIVGIHAPALRTKLRTNYALVDAGLAAGLLAIGQAKEATTVLQTAASTMRPGHRLRDMARQLITAAADADLPNRDPDLFAEFFATVAALSYSWPPASPALAVRLGPAGLATAAHLAGEFPADFLGLWSDWLAAAAAETGDLDTLHTLLENAAGKPWSAKIGRRLASALLHHGDTREAHAVAGAYGLQLRPRVTD